MLAYEVPLLFSVYASQVNCTLPIWCGLSFQTHPSMGLLFVCLAAHDSESRRWTPGVDPRICQTFAASPAEPGELPFWFSGEDLLRDQPADWRSIAESARPARH